MPVAEGFDGGTSATLSVVVASHRRANGLQRLLTALEPQIRNRSDREIIVVNDGSHSDAYTDVLAAFPNLVKYDASPSNLGVGATRNRAATLAANDYLVYTDDDCEPPSWWLDWLSARIATDPLIDVVAGTTRPLWKGNNRGFLERVQAHYNFIPHPWKTDQLDVFVTANVAIRRSLFLEIGGFRVQEQFLRAGEDTELSFRLAKRRAGTVVDMDWYVRHEVGGRLWSQMRRYHGYGYANVWITRLTTAPKLHTQFAQARFRSFPKHFRWIIRRMRDQSSGFSANRISRICSIAFAVAIQSSHFFGCAYAARQMRHEQRRHSTKG